MNDSKSNRRAKKRKPVVWVVIHCEFFPRNDGPIIDEMVFHVAGSLRAAENYLRPTIVMPYSWWIVERRVVDEADRDADDQSIKHYYNHRGQPRKKPPHAAAQRAFDKWQREEAAK